MYSAKLNASDAMKEEMAITPSFEESCVLALEYSLANFLYDQACFFAECLAVECPSDESLHILATTLVQCGQYDQAAAILQKRRSNDPRLRYLLGLCCFKTNKYEEAECALMGRGNARSLSASDMLSDVAGGAAGLYLLGQVKEKRQGCIEQAVECYAKCLEICPFMWCAYERLSWLILSVSSSSSLGAATACARSLQSATGGPGAFASAYFNDEKFDGDPTPTSNGLNGKNGPWVLDAAGEVANNAAVRKRRRNDVTSPMKYNADHTISTPIQPTSVLNGRTPLAGRSAFVASQSPDAMCSPSLGNIANQRSMFQSPVELLSRLSPRRLLSYPCSPTSPSQKRSSSSLLGATFAGSEVLGNSSDQNHGVEVGQRSWTPAREGCWTLASFLKILGESLHALHRFDCSTAYEAVKRLPNKHQNSFFTQNLVARCQFEDADFRKAITTYARCCDDSYFHSSLGLEYYSTALWQLSESLSLGCLARRALALDRSKPQAWCVAGNCFSLQRDHEQAIRCFRRAVQLDPSLTYAYTLTGHEFVELEKLDKASEMYEQALSTDSRHYNAWWGLGNLYLRQEDFQKAKYHFQKAVEINGKNALLRISLGQACIAMGETQKALQLFDIASRSMAGNAPACFHKGCVLVAMGRHAEAVEELHRAQASAPREPKIKYQLGLAYAGLGDSHKATLNFSMAMDLCGGKDSKDHQAILAAQAAMQDSRSRSGSI
jgi:anaphase-promoting complex subunit 3